MTHIYNLEGWRAAAHKKLPRVVFDFLDGGAEDEVSLRRNRSGFDDIELIPRVLRGNAEAVTETELFGQKLRLPVLLAPAGGGRLASRLGEIGAARGASAAGTVSSISGFSTMSPRLVSQAVPEPQWYQLYARPERALTEQAVKQAQEHGYGALLLTVDSPIAGMRERDVKNGYRVPFKVRPGMVFDAVRHPRWTAEYLRKAPVDPHDERGAVGTSGATGSVKSLAEYVSTLLHPHQTWDDLAWLRDIWTGPLLVKGILSGADAARVVEMGCDGVVVSNHGARQLDGVPGTIEALPEIVAAVDGRGKVLIDGGIRRGTDVAKALSLGADACLIGRPWLFSLAVGGAEGVATMLGQLHSELVRTLRLLGVGGIDELGTANVRLRGHRIDPCRASGRVDQRGPSAHNSEGALRHG